MLKNDVCLIATQNRFIKKELKGKEEDVIKFISISSNVYSVCLKMKLNFKIFQLKVNFFLFIERMEMTVRDCCDWFYYV